MDYVINLYLTRHGISQLAISKPGAHPPPEDPLSDLGLHMAETLADTMRPIGIDLVLGSTDQRASDTAHAISRALNVPCKLDALLVEWVMPTCIYGKTEAEYSHEYNAFKGLRRKETGRRFLDGESIDDVLDRTKRARSLILDLLQSHKLLVVSHYCFIKYFIACELAQTNVANPSLFSVYDSLELDNTSITHLIYRNETRRFQLISWNQSVSK